MTMHIIFNRLGKGKTTFLAWVGMVSYIQGKHIFSNFHLSFPHTFVDSAMDLRQMRNGVLLIDDAYQWFYARTGFNPLVNEVMAKSRKRGIDIFYTMVRSNQIDVNLRACTEFCWVPVIIPKTNIMIAPRFIYYPDRGMKGGDEERIGEPMGGYMIGNIDYIWQQFDTAEEIGNLKGIEIKGRR
jgi:hypothetical protein